jgi:hypothetical protein
LQQVITALQEQKRGRFISKKAEEQLREEYPELAEILFLDDASGETRDEADGSKKSSEQDINKVISEKVASVKEELRGEDEEKEKKIEMKLLSLAHPDWKKIATEPSFSAWKSSLPQEERQELDSSWSSEFLSEKLTAYKKWRGKNDTDKKKALENAITPRGDRSGAASATNDDEEAAFQKSFLGRR